jgi:hypothetical protein
MHTKRLKREGAIFFDKPLEQTHTQKSPARAVGSLVTQVLHALKVERSKRLRTLASTGKSEGTLQKTKKGDVIP